LDKKIRKGKGKGRKGRDAKNLSKEDLDRQLEKFMGPDAQKKTLDQELDAYMKQDGDSVSSKKKSEASPRKSQ